MIVLLRMTFTNKQGHWFVVKLSWQFSQQFHIFNEEFNIKDNHEALKRIHHQMQILYKQLQWKKTSKDYLF